MVEPLAAWWIAISALWTAGVESRHRLLDSDLRSAPRNTIRSDSDRSFQFNRISDSGLYANVDADVSVPAVAARSSRLVEIETSEGKWRGVDFGRYSNCFLLLKRDGQLQQFEMGNGLKLRELDGGFQPAAHRELEQDLLREFGAKFKTIRTPHYVVCHNTTDAFAAETSELVEQLYRSFTAYFGGRGMGFTRPQFPMVVLIFNDEGQFRRYVEESPGASGMTRVSGIYSVETNRIATFNASGKESRKYGNSRWQNISTVIHEATHQIAFNCGCHRRFADNPVWLAEGLAMYFETPEVRGQKLVWSAAGTLNRSRLDRFASYRKSGRRADSIKTLVMNDERFRSDATAGDAYAESYALTYFLVQQRMPQYLKYVRMMAAKRALVPDTPEQRLADFQAAFGQNMQLLEASFTRYMEEPPVARR